MTLFDSNAWVEGMGSIFFGALPLLGMSLRRTIAAVVFADSNYDLEQSQKEEIVRRFEFVGLLTAVLASFHYLALSILIHFGDRALGMFASIAFTYLGVALFVWLVNMGSVRFSALRFRWRLLVEAIPLVLFMVKIPISTIGESLTL